MAAAILIARFNEAVGSRYKVERGQLHRKGWHARQGGPARTGRSREHLASQDLAPCGVRALAY